MRARAGRALAIAALVLAAVLPARADQLSGYVELQTTRNRTESTDADGTRTDLDTDVLYRRVYLYADRSPFPNLRIWVGGFFEDQDLRRDLDGENQDADIRRLRPFLGTRLRSREWLAEALFNRDQQKIEPRDAASLETVRNSVVGTLAWIPDDRRNVRLELQHIDDRDTRRVTRDLATSRYDLTADIRPRDDLRLYYRGSLEEVDNRIEHNFSRTHTESGRATYGGALWGGRTQLSADYLVTWRRTDTRSHGAGEIPFQVFPVTGLSSIDDTPERDTLDPNPALIDENRTVGAGVNLGLPTVGGDDRPRNLGLDLGTPADVNTLRVYVDRELPEEIWSTFSWSIWTSVDGLDWTLARAAVAATFGPFDDRFELRFEAVRFRYLKAVVRPLAPSVPLASQYPTILVTELEAYDRRLASEVQGTFSRTSQRASVDARTRILSVPNLYHELSYFLNDSGATTTWTLSNGVSVSHRFNPAITVAARAAREDGRESRGDRVAYVYSTSLTATPVETFQQTVVFSGLNEDFDGRKNDRKSIFLYNVLRLYRGVDLNVGAGRAYIEDEDGVLTTSTQVNSIATLVPNPKLTFNVVYQDKTDEIEGRAPGGNTTQLTRAGEVNVSINPLTTLYLFGSYRKERRTGEEDRTIRNVALSWSPFPYGGLRVTLNYSETYRSQFDTQERIFTPALRWLFARRAYLDLAYQNLSTDSTIQTIDTEIVSATARVMF